MTDDGEEFHESVRAAAARRPPSTIDPEAEQAMDDAIAAARPRTHAHMRSLLETHDEAEWAALLNEEISSGLGSFGDVIEILGRMRAEYETFARSSDAFEESVAAAFAEVVASQESNAEVTQVAAAMLKGGWFTTSDVEQLAPRMEEVTAVAIAAIREHDLGTVRRQELGYQLHLASLKLLLA